MQILKMKSLKQEYDKLDDFLQWTAYVLWNLFCHIWYNTMTFVHIYCQVKINVMLQS
jgi:hypothetical protein